MSLTKRRVGFAAAIIVGLVVGLTPAVPVADAAVAPWTWKRVVQPLTVAGDTSDSVRALCPANYTAITGGLVVPLVKQVRPQAQYRQDDGSGSGWRVVFRNFDGSLVSGSVVAECVETADLPAISYNSALFARDGSGYAEGSVACLNAGEVVLTGGADWNAGATNRELLSSAPNTNQTSWYGRGYNPEADSLFVEVYCVQAANVPGYQHVEFIRTVVVGDGWYEDTVTCPVGKRILNGGTRVSSFASYPNLTTWTSRLQRFAGDANHTTRATCIDAGLPSVTLTSASPGPTGSQTNTGNAGFSMTGTDPAGYPNNFQCSIDGAAFTSCPGSADYTGLVSGPHTFEARNRTADGRTSAITRYEWTVDTVVPTVTKPKLPKVTLTPSAEAKWRGSDVHTGIDHYQATYRLLRDNGTATPWTEPADWSNIGRSLQTPGIEEGQTICVAVRSFDEVNNVSPWSAPSCTTRPFDDAGLDATPGWNRLTGNAFWLNTVTRTSASGQTLTRSDLHLSRVGILASVCNGCGAVVVNVGSTRIGRINLDAAATAHRKVKLLPAFPATNDVVTIRSVTSGKTISIDGLIPIKASAILPLN